MTDMPLADWNARVQETIRQLEGLVGQPGVSEDYVRLRVGLLRAQAAALKELQQRTKVVKSTHQRKTGPVLRPQTVRFDPAVARRLFDAVDVVFRSGGDPGVELDGLRAAVDADSGLLVELIGRAAFGPDEEYLAALAGRLEVPLGLLLLAGRMMAAPFLAAAAARIEPSEAAGLVSDGHCPICDAPPGLAQLRSEDGKRMLDCSLCGHRWAFERLVCPFCGNQDRATLGKLTVEGEPTRWIEVCRDCRQYLKTLDRRELPGQRGAIPLVEDVAGLYLDLLAEKEGYRPKPRFAAMLGGGLRGEG